MPTEQLLVFLTLTCVVSASPGPVMLACMAYSGRYGLTRSSLVMLGATLGNLILMLMSAMGLGLLLLRSPLLFDIIRWLGAAYLVWLGIQLWRSQDTPTQGTAVANDSNISLLLKSLGIALSNPKGLVYFGAVFPQFVTPAEPLVPQFALLTVIFVVMDLVWMLIYALAGRLVMAWLKDARHQQWFNRGSGLALILAGIALGWANQ